MASLKDLRNRIAATKATQKITKAMQMVAASKLRRAQAAAVSARPYAARMETVLGNIAASVAGAENAPRLLRGTGSDQKHLLLVCTSERGLCGPFNTAIVRLARERATTLAAEGKDVKFFCVGRKGYDQLRRQFPKQIVELVDLRSVRVLHFENAESVAEKIIALFDKSRPRSKSSRRYSNKNLQTRWAARSTSSSPRPKTFSAICCRAMSRYRFSAPFWKMPLRSTARRCRRWTMRPAMPAT